MIKYNRLTRSNGSIFDQKKLKWLKFKIINVVFGGRTTYNVGPLYNFGIKN
jgi:hypothetical protein